MGFIHFVFNSNFAWLLLIFGVLFIIAEAFVFSFGILGLVGLIAVILGLVILVDVNHFSYHVAIPFIVVISIILVIFLGAVIYLAVKARIRPIESGRERLLGYIGKVEVDEQGIARIRYRGELWQVKAEQILQTGQKVKVIGFADELVLLVKSEE